jgi:hypothetical protein
MMLKIDGNNISCLCSLEGSAKQYIPLTGDIQSELLFNSAL